ncbi:MAG: hypothetical protein FWF59_02595 [Turicibacter sp.]|nr:hypothetical protein [Turicibacter sp.]
MTDYRRKQIEHKAKHFVANVEESIKGLDLADQIQEVEAHQNHFGKKIDGMSLEQLAEPYGWEYYKKYTGMTDLLGVLYEQAEII